MKLLLPVGIAILGLGAGLGAGVALKPAPPAEQVVADDCVEGAADAAPGAVDGAAGAHGVEAGAAGGVACPTDTAALADPFAPIDAPKPKPEGETANVPLQKPFVVPIFKDDRVSAMIVSSLALDVGAEGVPKVAGLEPRLRDSFLAVMFRHANSGGFDGTFTEGRKMDDLGSALLLAAQQVFEEAHVEVYDVLITDIVRQDM